MTKALPVVKSLPMSEFKQHKIKNAEDLLFFTQQKVSSIDVSRLLIFINTNKSLFSCKYPGLIDPLKMHVRAFTENLTELQMYCLQEMIAGNNLKPIFGKFLANQNFSLTDLLSVAQSYVGFENSDLRKYPAFTSNKFGETPIIYPDPSEIQPLMKSLERNVRLLASRDILKAAILLHVGIIHTHPFNDGNKRTSRALYSAALSLKDNDFSPIPITILSSIDRESYTLKLKRALIFGKLAPLFLYFESAISAILDIQLEIG